MIIFTFKKQFRHRSLPRPAPLARTIRSIDEVLQNVDKPKRDSLQAAMNQAASRVEAQHGHRRSVSASGSRRFHRSQTRSVHPRRDNNVSSEDKSAWEVDLQKAFSVIPDGNLKRQLQSIGSTQATPDSALCRSFEKGDVCLHHSNCNFVHRVNDALRKKGTDAALVCKLIEEGPRAGSGAAAAAVLKRQRDEDDHHQGGAAAKRVKASQNLKPVDRHIVQCIALRMKGGAHAVPLDEINIALRGGKLITADITQNDINRSAHIFKCTLSNPGFRPQVGLAPDGILIAGELMAEEDEKGREREKELKMIQEEEKQKRDEARQQERDQLEEERQKREEARQERRQKERDQLEEARNKRLRDEAAARAAAKPVAKVTDPKTVEENNSEQFFRARGEMRFLGNILL